jgi:hypothetical protein
MALQTGSDQAIADVIVFLGPESFLFMADKSSYDFLQEVFEWVFYNMPIRSNNSYMRKLYGNYKKWGGLSKWQLQSLLDQVNAINLIPPFNPATLEAMIRKKGYTYRSFIPDAPAPIPETDDVSKELIEDILAIAPGHKTALFYQAKLNNNEILKPAEQDNLRKFLRLLTEIKQKKQQ